MKKTKLVLLSLVLLTVSISLSAQYFIDAENASVLSNGKLQDNGRTLTWALQGDNVSKPWIDSYSRSGSKSVGMRIAGASTGSMSQRTEYCLNACYPNPVNISDGATWYTGFSIYLSSEWANPSSWFVIQQTQQRPASGQVGNYPFALLEMASGNMLALVTRSGKNGNNQRNPSPILKHRNVITIQKGVWYDIVIGWRFRPHNNDGWIACWIKTANQTNYTRYGIDNIKVGYWGAPSKVQQNKVGMYRGRVSGNNKMFFDEVRFGTSFNAAKHPGNSSGTNYVSMRKRNAMGFAVDANNPTVLKNVHMWEYSSTNDNQKFLEIDRGGGYYSYQAKGTNLCIDGGNGASDNQNVVMYTCYSGTHNQHWKKVDVGSGYYRLLKRSNNSFALDGSNGGANYNNVKIYTSSPTNHNQEWYFGSEKSAILENQQVAESEFKPEIFPNPANDEVTIKIQSELGSNAKVYFYNTIGTLIKSVYLKNNNQNINIDNLASGVYIIEVKDGMNTYNQKLLKK